MQGGKTRGDKDLNPAGVGFVFRLDFLRRKTSKTETTKYPNSVHLGQ